MKKLFAMLLVVAMVLSMAACSDKDEGPVKEGTYTMRSYATALGDTWNPHTWEVDADNALLSYLETPLITMSIDNSEENTYQWVYKAATSIEDVTADHQEDLTKYGALLPEGQKLEDTKEGYVYEIKLNPAMKWEDGTPINADTYMYSTKALLDPEMKNYRANLFYSGESAIAGAADYFNSGAPIYDPIVPAYGEGEEPDYSYDLEAGIAAGEVYISLDSYATTAFGSGYCLSQLNGLLGNAYDAQIEAIEETENVFGYTQITAENRAAVDELLMGILTTGFGIPAEIAPQVAMECLFAFTGEYNEQVNYDDTVGFYKVDEYTVRYVSQYQVSLNDFRVHMGSNWLVYEPLYEAGKDTTGELVTTNYNTSKETTMSYGPYKIESLQKDKQIVFTQNENWYNYQKTESGYLYAMTDYNVDGAPVQQYQTNRIVIDVMTDEAAKQVFMKGELTKWAPPADEVPNFTSSSQMYKVDQDFTLSFFFNTDLDALKKMDASKGNKNSVVLSNYNFRKAMSLAIDRADWVTATTGYKPAFGLMSDIYYYDIYNDPNSSYRKSEPAMQAICDLYGVKYGEGTPYADLETAYKSINGFNLTEAKALMKQACDELVADGLYKKGEDIYIRIGHSKGALDSTAQSQITKINKYLNDAFEGSGFGKITLEPIANIPDRYGDVVKGEYAIGYGAWGGAIFYPFRNWQVYFDPTQVNGGATHENACWDPTTEEATLKVEGEDVTMTYQAWSNALIGNGPYANASFQTKLEITAQLEKLFLEKYYRIPLGVDASAFLLSYQVSYYTETYNVMYDFGGIELMTYNYDDAEWADYVKSQGGTLSYE